MTEYTDVPVANSLYMESQNIKVAIENIDGGGSVSSFIVSPPSVGAAVMTSAPMAVSVITSPPNDPTLLAAVRAQLVAREQEIAIELAALDVSYTPPARA